MGIGIGRLFDDLLGWIDMKDCKLDSCYLKAVSKGLCRIHYQMEYRQQNQKKLSDYRKTRYIKNRDKLLTIQKEYNTKNKETISQKKKRYYLTNKDKIKKYRDNNRLFILTKMLDYQKKNREKFKANDAKRRAAKLQRTPPWANLEVIKEIYKKCPPGYHVDHIIPLQGRNVSGLHVENNLQYLTQKENQSKGNRLGAV